MPEGKSSDAWRTTTILLGSMMTVMAGASIAAGLPGMARHFDYLPHAEAVVKSVLTTHALFIILFGPLAGWLLDRYGRKPVLIGAMILYGLAGSSGFFVDSIHAVFAGRAFLGMAVAALTSGFVTLIGDYFQGDARDRFMGLQGAFMGLGGMVFMFVGGLLADAGWRYPFLIYLYAFLILPAAALFLHEPSRESSGGPKEKHRGGGVPYRTLALVYAVAFVGMILFYMIPVHAPFFLMSLPDVSNTQVGLALAGSALPGVLVSYKFHWFRKRLSNPELIAVFYLIMGVGYFFLSQSTSYVSAALSLALAGTGLGLFMPTVNVWLVALVEPEIRGRVMGGMTTCLYLGQFLCPILTQPLAGRWSPAGAFSIIAVGLVGLALVFTFIARYFKHERRSGRVPNR